MYWKLGGPDVCPTLYIMSVLYSLYLRTTNKYLQMLNLGKDLLYPTSDSIGDTLSVGLAIGSWSLGLAWEELVMGRTWEDGVWLCR